MHHFYVLPATDTVTRSARTSDAIVDHDGVGRRGSRRRHRRNHA